VAAQNARGCLSPLNGGLARDVLAGMDEEVETCAETP
jgi:hypothetical protein